MVVVAEAVDKGKDARMVDAANLLQKRDRDHGWHHDQGRQHAPSAAFFNSHLVQNIVGRHQHVGTELVALTSKPALGTLPYQPTE